MSYIDNKGYSYSAELHNSIINNTVKREREFIISLSNIKLNKHMDNINLEQNVTYISGDLIFKDIILYGKEPVCPSRILDFSLVKDGEIFGNHIEYPFVIGGEIQFVITFESYEKLTVKARKMYFISYNSTHELLQ